MKDRERGKMKVRTRQLEWLINLRLGASRQTVPSPAVKGSGRYGLLELFLWSTCHPESSFTSGVEVVVYQKHLPAWKSQLEKSTCPPSGTNSGNMASVTPVRNKRFLRQQLNVETWSVSCYTSPSALNAIWNFQWSSWETSIERYTPVWPMLRTDTTLMWNNPPHLDSGPNTSFSFAISHQMSVLCHFKLCKSDWPSPKLTEKVFGTNCEHSWMWARWRLGDD